MVSETMNLMDDPRCTRAQFAQDLIEQVFIRTRTGDFRAGQVGKEYQIWLGQRLYANRDPHIAWSAVLRDLVDATDLSSFERANLDAEGATVEADEAFKDEELIDALTEGGMEPLGIMTQELRAKRNQALDVAFTVLVHESSNGGDGINYLKDHETLLNELSRASGLTDIDALEAKQTLERYNTKNEQSIK